MTNGEMTSDAAEVADRKAGLVVFGILQICFGALCALLVPLMLLAMLGALASRQGSAAPMNARMMVPSLLFYAVLAVWFIWMGIGSIQARRWARALILVSSWLWLICGLLGIAFALVFLPGMYEQMGKSGQVSPGLAAVMKYVALGFMAVFYVLIPGALVLFYGSKHVKATCERRDPQERWTDKCPLPVLAVSLMSGGWAASMLMMGCYGWAIPFFGAILSGSAGAGVVLAFMLLLGYVAWGMYRLNLKAWWCAVLMVIAWGVSLALTFSRVNLMEFYEKMNFPPEQLELVKSFAQTQTPGMVLFFVLWCVVALAYLLYTRRYFVQPEQA
ncbi:MAG: hypothetical protein ABSE73_02500 [Planctomycetota bacterium]